MMAIACLVLVVRTVSCFQWPSYVSGLYTEYGVVLFPKGQKNKHQLFYIARFRIRAKARVKAPDELLKLVDHPLRLGGHMAGLRWSHHSAGASFILPQAETDGLILPVSPHRDEELTLVSVLRLPRTPQF